MKALLTFSLILLSAIGFSQTTLEQASSTVSPYSEHLSKYSWLYIVIFSGIAVLFVVGFVLGWDKKLFKHKTADDNHQLFI